MSETNGTTSAKRARIVNKYHWNEPDLSLGLEFANGERRSYAIGQLPESVQRQLALNGLQMRLCDRFYQANGDVAKAVAYTDSTFELLRKGEWAATQRGTGGHAEPPLVVRAIARLTGKPIEAIEAKWDGFDKPTRKRMLDRPDVKSAMTDIQAAERRLKASGQASDEMPSLDSVLA